MHRDISPHASIVITPLGEVDFRYHTIELEGIHGTDSSATQNGSFIQWSYEEPGILKS
jgi:hypothetical protein